MAGKQVTQAGSVKSTRISHPPSTAAADSSVLAGCTPSGRLDVGSATPAPSSGPCTPPERRLGALATKGGEKSGFKAIGFGVLSTVLYLALFVFEDSLMAASTGGGWAFVVPVIVAFVFSYIHGAFTGHFWDALGIQAKKK